MNIYVGNLSFDVEENELRKVFEAFGEVTSVTIIKDKFTGRSRGFAFVEMPSRSEAQTAIDSLNGTDFKGRSLSINEARPRTENPRKRTSFGGGDKSNNRKHGGGGSRRRY